MSFARWSRSASESGNAVRLRGLAIGGHLEVARIGLLRVLGVLHPMPTT